MYISSFEDLESDKTQENISHKRFRSALSQQVINHKAAKNTQDSLTKTNTNDKKDPQKKHCLVTVSKKYWTA